MLTRRQFLQCTSIMTGASALSMPSASAYASGPKSLSALDEDIIGFVKKLKKDQDVRLTILHPKGCLPNIESFPI